MAAEEKKPKIDLKARLGKQGAGAPAPAPFAPGAPVAPPGAGKSISSLCPLQGQVVPSLRWPRRRALLRLATAARSQVGVPMPPLRVRPSPRPILFALRFAPTRSAAPQTFKIEIDDETIRAARKGGKRAGILATITALGGLGLGFAWGGARQTRRGPTSPSRGPKSSSSTSTSRR